MIMAMVNYLLLKPMLRRIKSPCEKGLAVDNCYEKMIKQTDKYWNKLFADPIRVSTDD